MGALLFKAAAPQPIVDEELEFWLSYDPGQHNPPTDEGLEELERVILSLRSRTNKLVRTHKLVTGSNEHGKRWTPSEKKKLLRAFKKRGNVTNAVRGRSKQAQEWHLTKLLMHEIASGRTAADVANEYGHPVDVVLTALNPMHK
jgi:hypothetical protein